MERPPSRRARIAFALWVGVILIIVVPWYRWQGHTHWANVEWIPFSRPSDHVRDAVLNTLFYVPFGLLYRRMMPRHTLGAVVAAFLLSSATELTQVYSHGRFPSSTDVLSNSIGAWIGMRWYDARSDLLRTRAQTSVEHHDALRGVSGRRDSARCRLRWFSMLARLGASARSRDRASSIIS